MEIKVLCPCGAKFKFDVEPVNGQSPGAVSCPVCGADSTAATNALIAQQLAAAVPKAPVIQPISVSAAPSSAPASSSSSTPNVSIPAVRIPTPAAAPAPIRVTAPAAAAPAPSAPVAAASAAPMSPKMTVMPVPEGGRALSVKPPGEATNEAGTQPAPSNAAGDPKASGSPKMAFMPAPVAGSGTSLSVAGQAKPEATPAHTTSGPPQPVPVHPATGKFTSNLPESSPAEGRFGLGVTGAIIGSLIGAVIWYVLAVNVIEGWRILAWIPGITGGFLAILLAKRPSEKLGIAAAVVAGVITIAMQFIVISAINDKRLTEASEENYRDMMAVAKKAADAKTDLQVKDVMDEDPEYGDGAARSVKELLEKLGVEMEKAKKEEAARASGQTMSDEQKNEVEDYRKNRLPELIKFSKGDPSRTRYLEQERTRLEEDGYILYRKKWFWMGIWIFSSIQSAFYFGRGKKK